MWATLSRLRRSPRWKRSPDSDNRTPTKAWSTSSGSSLRTWRSSWCLSSSPYLSHNWESHLFLWFHSFSHCSHLITIIDRNIDWFVNWELFLSALLSFSPQHTSTAFLSIPFLSLLLVNMTPAIQLHQIFPDTERGIHLFPTEKPSHKHRDADVYLSSFTLSCKWLRCGARGHCLENPQGPTYLQKTWPES